ncbi:MAG: hypothetical protein Q4F57_07020 [Weeksellaceae bacterium]|nr:hypothetical protein [Weeksellaceae bacterium]
MKHILLTLALAGSALLQAQVAIEQAYITNSRVILEFNDQLDEENALRNAKGIVLPVVTQLDAASVPGTIFIDAADNQVKILTINQGPQTLSKASPNYDFQPVDSTLVEVGEGVVIGVEDAAPPGVLVLNDDTKAMVLPVVESVVNVRNPEPGMWVYEQRTRAMAFYNGEVWTLYQ